MKFRKASSGYWKDPDNGREFLLDFASKNSIVRPKDWSKVKIHQVPTLPINETFPSWEEMEVLDFFADIEEVFDQRLLPFFQVKIS